jgi:hypothetical protein
MCCGYFLVLDFQGLYFLVRDFLIFGSTGCLQGFNESKIGRVVKSPKLASSIAAFQPSQ